MPRDKRLYMTFPNDFPNHPKIMLLSDAAFRTFVEMNGYSRVQDLDGRIPEAIANRLWKPRALKELLTNHTERPTLTLTDGEYVIHDYAEHQETKRARMERKETNTVNGSKGGRPRKRNPNVTESVTEGNPVGTRSETEPKPELEIEIETELNTSTDVDVSPRKRGAALPDLSILFEQAYAHWPKKVERKEAAERFRQAAKKVDPHRLATIIARFGDAYADTTPRHFTPALGAWLYGERWGDDLPTVQTTDRRPTRTEQNLDFVAQLRREEERQERNRQGEISA